MKYFKLFLMWLGIVAVSSYFAEYIISREVNGIIQLLCLVGLVVLIVHVGNETVNLLINKKKEKND